MSFKESTYKTRDGVELHLRKYTEEYKPPASKKKRAMVTFRILCLHGWMDNVQSFNKYVPALMTALTKKGGPDTPVKIELLSFDWPGHGLSTHKSLDASPELSFDYVYYLYDLVHGELRWGKEKVIMIGHSLGASLALMYAAVWPVHRLVMLDAMGPETLHKTVKSMKMHVENRFFGKPHSAVYKTFDQAVEHRIKSVTDKKGDQTISREAAETLVRGSSTILDDGRCKYSFDARIKWPFALYMTQSQKDEIYDDVAEKCRDEDSEELFGSGESDALKIIVILAERGTVFTPEEISHFKKKVQPERFTKLPGSHHFHMDEDSYEQVVKISSQFLLGF